MYRSPDQMCPENGRVRDFRVETSSKDHLWDDLNKVLLANEARKRSPSVRNSVQNFETFSFPRGVMEKPSKYGVVTHDEKILSANHGSMSHLVPNHMHPPPYTTKNAFVQTVVEAKPRRVVAGGGK